jgi:D-alanyl-D-alanine carboxypeptidase
MKAAIAVALALVAAARALPVASLVKMMTALIVVQSLPADR